MEIILKSIKDLKPYSKNARFNKKAVPKVKASIKEFGFKVPVIIDKNDVIISGHTRLEAAKELKIDFIPCIVADDLTDAQAKAFRLADNKTAEFSEWDFDVLAQEMDELKNLNLDLDLSDFGFLDLGGPIEFEEAPEENGEELKDIKVKMCRCPKCQYEAAAKDFKI